MVTIKTFDNPIDAHMLRTKLESEGIPCYLADEHIVGINPMLNLAVGGIKLNVAEEDVAAAISIISESQEKPISDQEGAIISCPICQSTHILNNINHQKGFASLLATALSLFSMTYPIYTKKSYLCKDCGHVFPMP